MRDTRIAKGQPTSIPGHIVKRHVLWLRDTVGFGDPAIAAAAGVSHVSIHDIRTNDFRLSQFAVGSRILAVGHRPVPAQAGLWVPTLGSRRRAHALAAIGWSYTHVSERLGVTVKTLSDRIARPRHVYEHWAAIHDIYEELSGTPGPSNISRRRAAQLGFATPLAWEGIDIDHPAAVPAIDSPDTDAGVDEVLLARLITGQHTAPADTIPAADREAFLDHAVAHGWTGTQVAEALQINRKAGDHLLRRRKRKLAEEAAA